MDKFKHAAPALIVLIVIIGTFQFGRIYEAQLFRSEITGIEVRMNDMFELRQLESAAAYRQGVRTLSSTIPGSCVFESRGITNGVDAEIDFQKRIAQAKVDGYWIDRIIQFRYSDSSVDFVIAPEHYALDFGLDEGE